MDKTNVMRIIEDKKIPYQAFEYPHGKEAVDGLTVAKLLNQDVNQVFKTLVTKGLNDYYVFLVPVCGELNLKKAASLVHEKSVEMIRVADINKVTGYIRGGCSPLGMKKEYKTVVDETAILYDYIMFSAGKIGLQVAMNPYDLEKIKPIIFGDIQE